MHADTPHGTATDPFGSTAAPPTGPARLFPFHRLPLTEGGHPITSRAGTATPADSRSVRPPSPLSTVAAVLPRNTMAAGAVESLSFRCHA